MLHTLRRIVQAVNAAYSLEESLQFMVHHVRETFNSEACSIFLIDQQKFQYVLMATEGLNQEMVGQACVPQDKGMLGLVGRREEPVNCQDMFSHPECFRLPGLGEDAYRVFLGVPVIHQRRLFGVLVVQKEETTAFDESEEAFLVTIAAQLAAVIAHAESTGALANLLDISEQHQQSGQVYSGLSSNTGVGVGQVVVIYPRADLSSVPDRTIESDQIEEEVICFEQALQTVTQDIAKLSSRLQATLPREELAIFNVYLDVLSGRSLTHDVVSTIRQGQWAQGALRRVIKRYMRRFEELDDDYLSERAVDFHDLGQRLLAALQARQARSIAYPEHTILVGEEITASDLVEVPDGLLQGIVSVRGASNSHVAILARALGVPAVMGVKGIVLHQLNDVTAIVDGYIGQVYVSPLQDIQDEYQVLLQEEQELNESLGQLRNESAETPDGHRLKLYVNIGLAMDASLSLSVGAEGIGLYRSEVPFLTRDRFPSEQEQYVIYRQLLQAFAPRPVTMRTLDVGGDKALPYFPIEEPNPFLGWRGIRITLDHPEVFLMQLRAMLRANAKVGNLHILLPMITSVHEIDEALLLIKQAHHELVEDLGELPYPPVGIMIEVPSAVYMAKELANKVDFVSVGTNDLIQYLLAVDRNNHRVATLYDGLHPAVIRALLYVADAVHGRGKPVSVCGEIAGDPLAVILLLAMGYDALSLNSTSLPRMKWVIRNFTMTQARKILGEVLSMDNSTMIRLHLEKAIEQAGLGGLIRAGKH